jgi:hypothetical protein
MKINIKTIDAVVDILMKLYDYHFTSEEYAILLSIIPKSMELVENDVIDGSDIHDENFADTFYRLRDCVHKACVEVFLPYKDGFK